MSPIPPGIAASAHVVTSTFTPAALTPLVWLRGNDLPSGTFTTWPDASGNGKHGVGDVASSAEVKTPNGGLAASFVPDNSGITIPALSFGSSAEVWYVIRTVQTGSTAAWAMSGYDADMSHFPFSNGTVYDTTLAASRQVFDPTMTIAATWRVYHVSHTGTTWTARLDGVTQATATVGYSPPTYGPLIGQGRISGVPNAAWLKGHIAEVVIRNGVSTAGQRASMHAYFNTTHGLAIA